VSVDRDSDRLAREQEAAAGSEAARIGGEPSEHRDRLDPVSEAGGGQAEGFEEAERELIENASHGDQHAARRVLQDAPDQREDPRAAEDDQGDRARPADQDA
jgi:hypothetical protein